MPVTYQVEKFAAIAGNVEPIWFRHWIASGLDHDKVMLDPDVESYHRGDASGMLHIVTVRKDGGLIGYYFNWIMQRGLHYKIKEAHADIYFVDCQDAPMSRVSRYRGLFRFVENELKAIGVKKAFTAVKDHADVGAIWLAIGWKPMEQVYYTILEA